jgi:hypothetical protein
MTPTTVLIYSSATIITALALLQHGDIRELWRKFNDYCLNGGRFELFVYGGVCGIVVAVSCLIFTIGGGW